MKSTVNKLESNTAVYNSLVKEKYQINENGMEYLIINEISTDAEIAYHEISSYMTKSGHAEIFEPEL